MLSRKYIVLISILLIAVGCANNPASVHHVNENLYVVDYNASRRGAYVHTFTDETDANTLMICAEPAPDIAVSITADLKAHLQNLISKEASIEARAKIAESIIDLAKRGQTLQIQREALYRLCELHANADLKNEIAAELYLEVIKTIQAIAFAELANSNLSSEAKKALLDDISKGTVLKPK